MAGSGLGKRIGFRLGAALLGLVLLEGVALVAEVVRPERTRSVPTAAPGDASAFEEQVRKHQDELGHVLPMVEDEARSWSLQPGEEIITHDGYPVRVNSMKMRGPELGARVDGDMRLLTLGDSSVFGHNVPEADVFSTVGAAQLTERWGRPVTPVIGATPGYDSGQALQTLEMFGAEVQPSWVVIGTLWSDIYVVRAFDAAQTDAVESPWLDRALGHLATYRLLRRGLRRYTPASSVPWIASPDDIGLAPDGSDCRVPLADYRANLRAMADHAAALGARPAFLILPAPMDFDPAVPPPKTVRNYRAAMRETAAELAAPVVDGPQFFRGKGAGIAWFMDQCHPTAEGHHLLGEALAEALEPVGPPAEGVSFYSTPTVELVDPEPIGDDDSAP